MNEKVIKLRRQIQFKSEIKKKKSYTMNIKKHYDKREKINEKFE